MSRANWDNLGCLFTYLHMRACVVYFLSIPVYLMSFGIVRKKNLEKGSQDNCVLDGAIAGLYMCT